MQISPQIPLPLEPLRADRFEDFLPGPNAAALDAVRRLLDEPGGALFLSGPRGSGKSHLLNAACHAARERGMSAFYVPLRRMPRDAAAGLAGLQAVDLVCVDDLDQVAGEADWERALFGCFNDLRAARGRLVVSSGRPLATLSLALPDLGSRLAWGVRQTLQPLDDADKLQVLHQRAQTTHLELPGDVASYLLRYGRRDLVSLLDALEHLRQAAFAGKRRITVPLAKDILGEILGDRREAETAEERQGRG